MNPIQFVHLTDTHLNAPDKENLFAKLQLADKVRRVFSHIHQSGLRPSFVLITGDLAHEGDSADYAYIRKLVDEGSAMLGAPVYVILGNHDHRAPFREGYLGETSSEEAYYYSHTIDGLRLIGLNSQIPGHHNGMIDDQQLSWLAEQLSTPAPRGTIVAIHHPLSTVIDMPGYDSLQNVESIRDVLAGSDVIGIMAGHVHSNHVGTFHGILSVAASGTAFGGELAEAEHFRMFDACSYNVVTVDSNGVTVSTIALPTSNAEIFRFPLTALAEQR
ncbi:metallophosphoesterase family protein [Paenibacillus hodogayensis]|uniref:Metallophosphoesterase family protein n=1 Tax=Paenibacillus hodogayensis TaxID=279208 RepID=A0ABV5VXK7_9BACL